MGLGDQKDIYRKAKEIAPSAFREQDHPWPGHRVVISDELTRLSHRTNKKRENKELYTGLEYYKLFSSKIRKCISTGTKTYVGVWDFRNVGVPEKKRCQDDRAVKAKKREEADAKKGNPIPVYCEEDNICDDGIRHANGEVEVFDLRGIGKVKPLRDQLMSYICNKIENEPLPDDVSVIVDYHEDGPLLFIRESPDKNYRIQLVGLKSPFVEFDIRGTMWARIFSTKWEDSKDPFLPRIDVHSTDSDLFLALSSLVEQTQPQCPIYLIRGVIITRDKTAPKRHHPNILINAIVEHFNLAGIFFEAFAAYCHIFGSDFVEKKYISHRTGFYKNWGVFKDFKSELADLHASAKELEEHGIVTVWDRILADPDSPKEIPVCFYPPPDQEEKEEEKKETKSQPKKLSKIMARISQFCDRLIRRSKADKRAEDIEVIRVIFSVQYQQFPWKRIQVKPPSRSMEAYYVR